MLSHDLRKAEASNLFVQVGELTHSGPVHLRPWSDSRGADLAEVCREMDARTNKHWACTSKINWCGNLWTKCCEGAYASRPSQQAVFQMITLGLEEATVRLAATLGKCSYHCVRCWGRFPIAWRSRRANFRKHNKALQRRDRWCSCDLRL